LSLAILDYAVNAGLLTVEQQNGIALTTVTRYLTSPIVRSALGLTDRRELIVNVDRSEFNSVLSHFLEDIFSGTVHSRSNSTERAEYGRNLIASGHAPATKLPNSYSPSEQITPESASNSEVTDTVNDNSARRQNNRNPDFGKKIISANYAAHISDDTTKRVFDELRSIDASKFPFATTALLRVFMERVCRAYAKKCGLGDKGDLSTVVGRCANHMENKAGAPKSIFHVWRVLSSDPKHYLSPGTLGSYIHGGTTPVLSELRRGWTDLKDGFTLMLDAID